jgi:hypothetical protein
MLRNPEAEAFFAPLSAHGDAAAEFMKALEKLGEYAVESAGREYGARFAVTAETVFGGVAGMATTYWRLSSTDRAIALATGAAESKLGGEWVEIALFRNGWPSPDLPHWARCAYRYARTRH